MGYGTDTQKKLFYRAPAFVKDAAATFYGGRERKRRQGAFYDRHFAEAEEFQWFTTARLQEIQIERVGAFLRATEKSSPWFRELFQKHGFNPANFSSLDALRALPVLSKPILRANLDRIISPAHRDGDVHWVNTSGTTGFGLRFPETWECFQREYATRFHNYHCGGIEVGDRWAFCAGHPVADPARDRPPFWVHDRANHWLLMSSSHLAEKNLRHYVDELERFRPDMIGGYPSSVYVLALANQALGRRVKPRAIYTSSESLLGFQRAAIEESFGCAPRSYYGNGERCGFIGECPQARLHVRMEHSLIEFLDDEDRPAAPGQSARMIVTGFGNPATPLIRYDIGDLAVVAENQTCPCGRGGVLLESLDGRVEDYIVTPDGRFAGRLDHLFKDAAQVRLAQIVQEEVSRVILRVVREPGYGAADEAAILQEARLRLGPEIQITFEYVDDIERSRTGKFRFVLSKLKGQALYGQKVPAAQI
jgi:phenylacetate-CoA ligase